MKYTSKRRSLDFRLTSVAQKRLCLSSLMCRAMITQCLFQLALFSRSESSWIKNIFYDVDIVAENKSKCGLSGFVLISTTSTRHNSFPKHFFVLFLHVEGRVWESFWSLQVAHLHDAARALSSPSRCFQLSTNLDKDFCRHLWYCGRKIKSNVV